MSSSHQFYQFPTPPATAPESEVIQALRTARDWRNNALFLRQLLVEQAARHREELKRLRQSPA
ncbi:MAG: hypothetical protein OXF97_08945 [Nitrospira sp.]|nr:hypothetical protein [Nitrospira sp.]MCY3956639.1 hypothetical protein [Nitrospira sp.]